MKMREKAGSRGRALLALAVSAAALPVMGQQVSTWVAERGTGNWSDAQNWDPAVVPGSGAVVVFGGSEFRDRTLDYDYAGPALTLAELRIDLPHAGTNVVLMAGNALSAEAVYVGSASLFRQSGGTHRAGSLTVGHRPWNDGRYELSGTGKLAVAGATVVGQRGGAEGWGFEGVFTQTGGTHAADALILGRDAGSAGMYQISGGTLAVRGLHVGGGANDAAGGRGRLVVDRGGDVSVADVLSVSDGDLTSFALDGGTVSAWSVQARNWSNVILRSGTLNLTGGVSRAAGTLRVGGEGAATLNLSAGELAADGSFAAPGAVSIGYGRPNAGTFNHTGGTHTTQHLWVGDGGTGTYAISGGASLTVLRDAVVGNGGAGVFDQRGGSVRVGDLVVGADAGTGRYTLGGAASSLEVGSGLSVGARQSQGTFAQVAGAARVGWLTLGSAGGGRGTYGMSNGASLWVGSEERVGDGGAGAFHQSGGSHFATAVLVGTSGGGDGTFSLGGASSLEVARETAVGADGGTGRFTQDGGSHVAPMLTVGGSGGGIGSYALSGPASLGVRGDVRVGWDDGTGAFVQAGGELVVEGRLVVGSGGSARGGYELTGGVLRSPRVEVAATAGARGTFAVTGGELSTDRLQVGVGTNGGAFVQRGGVVNVRDVYTDGAGALAVEGGTFNLTGGWSPVDSLAVRGGTFNLRSRSYLSVSTVDGTAVGVGAGADGTFDNSGGSTGPGGARHFTPRLVVGAEGAVGTYRLHSSGTLDAGTEQIGSNGTGTFDQLGGAHSVEFVEVGLRGGTGTFNHASGTVSLGRELTVGIGAGSTGRYALAAGSALSGGRARFRVGADGGTGSFVNAGGTHTASTFVVGESGGTGTYSMAEGATLEVGIGEIGKGGGTGTFGQAGGLHRVRGSLWVGYDSTGTYTMGDGATLAVSLQEHVGWQTGARGTFVQSGGTHTVDQDLSLGYATGAVGTYTLTGGTLAARSMTVGGTGGTGGTGRLDVTGGSAMVTEQVRVSRREGGGFTLAGGTVTAGSLWVEDWSRVTFTSGTLNLGSRSGGGGVGHFRVGVGGGDARVKLGGEIPGGGLNVSGSAGGGLSIGYGGGSTGRFDQVRGSVSTPSLVVGHGLVGGGGSATGSYTMAEGATLNATTESIGKDGGRGSFVQNGGYHSTATLIVGDRGTGTFTLGPAGLTASRAVIGNHAAGAFTQTDGGHNVTGGGPDDGLRLGVGALGVGTYDLSGGTLTTVRTHVGVDGRGTFRHAGGTHYANSGLTVAPAAGGTGEYVLSGDGFLRSQAVVTVGGGGGRASFVQSGGSHVLNNGVLTVNADADGYALSGGSLRARVVNRGTFAQSGGTFTGSVTNLASFDLSGGTLAATAVANDGAYRQAGGAAAVGAMSGSGSASVSGGVMTATHVRQAALTVGTGGRVAITAGGGDAGVSRVGALAVEAGGTLDLADNAVVVDYDVTSPLASVRDAVVRGHGAGVAAHWGGAGIVSSAAAADASKAVGYAEAADVLGLAGGQSAVWRGQSVDATAVLIRYTLAGDANLDGAVDFADLVRLAQNYETTVPDTTQSWWYSGDFTYDGVVDFNDLVKLAQNYDTAATVAPLAVAADWAAAVASVPEPTAALLAVAACGLAGTGRRRRG
jgi:hypothetical protein